MIDACAAVAPGRESTWINRTIRELYGELFRGGRCHSVEAYRNGALVGGLYGVSLGRAFSAKACSTGDGRLEGGAGPSCRALEAGGYRLLDAQFVTRHLARFGALEVDRALYQTLLAQALVEEADAATWRTPMAGPEALALAA